MSQTWLTYDPGDDHGRAADFIAAELERAGLPVHRDPRDLTATGRPLWNQFSGFFLNPNRVAAWCVYLTEETLAGTGTAGTDAADRIAEAIAQARTRRKEHLPAAVLCPGSLPAAKLPAELGAFDAVQMADQYWTERLRALVEGRRPRIPPPGLKPYVLTLHAWGRGPERGQALEIRPKQATWSPFVVGVPENEREAVRPQVLFGSRGRVPLDAPRPEVTELLSSDGRWWIIQRAQGVSRETCCFLLHRRLPDKILFGGASSQSRIVLRLRPVR